VSDTGTGYFSGFVGVGTSAPAASMHILESSPTLRLEESGSTIFDLSVGATVNFRRQSNAAPFTFTQGSTEALRIDTAGNVGVNNALPAEKLDIAAGNVRVNGGQAYSTVYNAGSATSIDWNNGNVQYTSAAPPTTITFSNMKDGGSYTLLATSTSAGVFTFNDDTSTFTFKFQPANGSTAANKETVYTFIRVGTKVYVSWITGF
jgi:hypothetical protein